MSDFWHVKQSNITGGHWDLLKNGEPVTMSDCVELLGLKDKAERKMDRYHSFLLHLYGSQQELDDILKKFEKVK